MSNVRDNRHDTRDPSPESLREMPDIDFRRYIVLPNPFAARVRRDGIRIRRGSIIPPTGRPKRTAAPSKASLSEMPELDMSQARPNRFSASIQAGGITLRIGRGRPKRGTEVGPTTVRSVRLPVEIWEAVKRSAKRRGLTVHAALCEAIAIDLVFR
jgi:hypothetical protein